MFGIGFPEMIIILAVALIVVGPEKLPEIARSLAKGIVELKRTMNQLKDNFNEETDVIDSVQSDLQATGREIQKKFLSEDFQPWNPDEPGEHKAIDLQPDNKTPVDAEQLYDITTKNYKAGKPAANNGSQQDDDHASPETKS